METWWSRILGAFATSQSWLDRLRAQDYGRVSKHVNGRQKPRNYRRTLRVERKRQRAERRKHRFG